MNAVREIGLRKKSFGWPVLITLANLILSLGFCFLVYPHFSDATSGLDPDGYGAAGKTWLETGRFDPVQKSPVYPAFIALLGLIFGGYHIPTIQIAQCLISAITCFLLYFVFLRAFEFEEGMAGLAGLAWAIYPISIWYIPRLWTETLLTLMLALYSLALIRFLQQPGRFGSFLCGLTIGMSALTKGIALIFLPLTLMLVILVFRRHSLKWVLTISLGALLLIAPWIWRTWQVSGAVLPIHAGGGYNFYLGNGFTRHWIEAPFSYIELKNMTEEDIQRLYAGMGRAPADPLIEDRVLLQAGLAEIWQTPILGLKKLLIQSLNFWYLAGDLSKSALTGILQIPVVLIAGVGALRAFQHRSWARCLLIPVLGIMGSSVLVFSFGRLSATIMPYLVGLSIYWLWPVIKLPYKCLTPE
jgi:Dolichyl-phosphate-mannose-protein mannosyltransferase